jgi:hypothetical protein
MSDLEKIRELELRNAELQGALDEAHRWRTAGRARVLPAPTFGLPDATIVCTENFMDSDMVFTAQRIGDGRVEVMRPAELHARSRVEGPCTQIWATDDSPPRPWVIEAVSCQTPGVRVIIGRAGQARLTFTEVRLHAGWPLRTPIMIPHRCTLTLEVTWPGHEREVEVVLSGLWPKAEAR